SRYTGQERGINAAGARRNGLVKQHIHPPGSGEQDIGSETGPGRNIDYEISNLVGWNSVGCRNIVLENNWRRLIIFEHEPELPAEEVWRWIGCAGNIIPDLKFPISVGVIADERVKGFLRQIEQATAAFCKIKRVEEHTRLQAGDLNRCSRLIRG